MSFSVDVNVLLYASDADSRWHAPARDFLAAATARRDPFCLAWPTLMSYLRIVTHPRILRSPLSPAEAQSNIGALLALPRARALAESDGFWATYQELAGESPVRGNLVPDAHLAALLQHHGVETLYTRDRDFLKFPSLRVRDPFAG